MPAMRAAENYFPGQIIRTLQVSTFASQFDRTGQLTHGITGEMFGADKGLRAYYSKLTGRNFESLATYGKGVFFHEGALYHGAIPPAGVGPLDLRDKLLSRARIVTTPSGRNVFGEAYATALGVPKRRKIWHQAGEYTRHISERPQKSFWVNALGAVEEVPTFKVIGGSTVKQDMLRVAHATATELVERFNALSSSVPMEFIPHRAGTWLASHGLELGMGVVPGPAGKTLLKLAGKWTAVAGGLIAGYSILDSTLNHVGLSPTKWGTRAYTGSQVNTARIAQITGAHWYGRKQEEIAPGSTSLTRLAGFPLLGAFIGATAHYAQRIGLQAQLQKSAGLSAPQALEAAILEMGRFGPGHEPWFNALGAAVEHKTAGIGKVIGRLHPTTPLGLKTFAGAAIGLALIAPFLPGALAPSKTPEELQDIYSGRTEVPIRKGRWWELGRSRWEGANIEYFRPNWNVLAETDARDISLYGKKTNFLSKFIQGNFTYNFERQHFRDRPYPLTGAAFQEIPLIGPVLAKTLGPLVKPQLWMHKEEFARQSSDTLTGINEQFKELPLSFGEHRATEIGELGTGAPMQPQGLRGTISEQWHKIREASGLKGWALSALKGAAMGGQDEFFAQETRFDTANRGYGMQRSFWDRSLGGLGELGEIFRRLIPSRHKDTPLYNPIRNDQPSWMPGPGDRSPDFQHGDPYAAIPYGEVRLPGAGYNALHPELEGINPQDYSDVWKYKILSDVAPYSNNTKFYRAVLQSKQNKGELDKEETAMFMQSKRQTEALKNKKDFSPYQYKGRIPLTPWGLAGKYWETLAHNVETPIEYLTPISPAMKLIHMRTAVEDYERTVAFGGTNSFWTHPLTNFVSPFVTATAHYFGSNNIPSNVQKIRDTTAYFDALKYIKFSRLAHDAQKTHDVQAQKEFEQRASETMVGVNPYTYNYADIFRGLPRAERDYFNEFSAAEGKDRETIMDMIPENEKGLYISRWRMNESENLRQAIAEKKLAGPEKQRAEAFINEVMEDRTKGGGMPHDKELQGEYFATKQQGETYGEWYRREKVLPEALKGRALPGPNWVGWHPAVDLEDVKFKYVQNAGADMHDYDLWSSDAQNVARRPYINDELLEDLGQDQALGVSDIRLRLNDLLKRKSLQGSNVSIAMYPAPKTEYNVDVQVEEERTPQDLKKIMERGI